MKFTYDKNYEVYKSENWELEKVGGFITTSHWWVHNEKENIHFWQGTKKEAIELIEKIVSDQNEYINLNKLYRTSLY